MEIRLWRELLIPYELAVKDLVMKFKLLQKEHREKNLYSPIEQVTGRVKSINSILKKCRRSMFPGRSWRRRLRTLPVCGLSASFAKTLKRWRL